MVTLLHRSLRYYQLPGKPPFDYPQRDLHDRVYAFWKDFWTRVYKANGTDQKPKPDDFLRQNYVGVIEHAGNLVALHAHSFYNLACAGSWEHSYFTGYFTETYLAYLRERGLNRVMSMELYSVSPDWRTAKLGVSLAAVMIGLGLKLARDRKVDAAVGVARSDVGVDHLVQEQGARIVGEDIRLYNTPCKQILFHADSMHPHPDEKVRGLVDHFWKNRIETLKPTDGSGRDLPKAA